jgi:hypothetical protein
MHLHESHDEGGFGVPNNTILRHAAAYATNARFVAFLGTFARPAQEVWLPGNDLHDPAPPPGTPPPFILSSTCTQHFCRTTTARSSLHWTCPHCCQSLAAMPQPTQSHHHHLRPCAPRTPALAPSSFHNLTTSTRHTIGDREQQPCRK